MCAVRNIHCLFISVERAVKVRHQTKTAMSVRQKPRAESIEAKQLQTNINEIKDAQFGVETDNNILAVGDSVCAFTELSEVEKSAASLGISPGSFKPISFLNTGHYDALIKANMLDDTLARRIEAFRVVADTKA